MLAAEFTQLENRLDAQIGVAVSAVGSEQPSSTLGGWQVGPAWSTIKVPLAIAGLREQDLTRPNAAMTAAITESDNAAAEAIWQDLGDPVTAAHKVENVLRDSAFGSSIRRGPKFWRVFAGETRFRGDVSTLF